MQNDLESRQERGKLCEAFSQVPVCLRKPKTNIVTRCKMESLPSEVLAQVKENIELQRLNSWS